jgi:dGTPase
MKADDKGFKHNLQSLRVVCDLEKIYDHQGLNLTNFVLWGMKNHSNPKWNMTCSSYDQDSQEGENQCYLLRNPQACKPKGVFHLEFYTPYDKYTLTDNGNNAWSFEGGVVALADEIAQRHHDVEDALRMGIVDQGELIDVLQLYFGDFLKGSSKLDQVNKRLYNRLSNHRQGLHEFLPYLSKFIVHFYNHLLITNSKSNLQNFITKKGIKRRQDFIDQYISTNEDAVRNCISFISEFEEKDRMFQKFLRNRILNSFKVQQMDGKGRFVIRRLFKAYLTNPRQLFDSTILAVYRIYEGNQKQYFSADLKLIGSKREEIDKAAKKAEPMFQIALLRAICDNISGMTDNFALKQHESLYG